MSFVQRLIDVSFRLGPTADGNPNVFSETKQTGPSNTITLTGLRVSAKIVKAGFPQLGQAQITIYGMTKSIMDQISTLGIKVQLVPRNTITVFAGDNVNGKSIVFIGIIRQAWGDFSAEPDVPFHVEADVAFGISNIPYNPSSFNGPTDAVTVLFGLARAANLNFENNGVQGFKLNNPYFYGSPLDQIKKVKEALQGKVQVYIDDTSQTLAIWIWNGFRTGIVPLVSSSTGLIAYPNYNAFGITLRTVFNQNIGFMKQIKVQSTLGDGKPNTGANGLWNVFGIDHDLESQVIGGQWFSTIQAVRPGQPTPVQH